ncbi:UNVERIFIED_CONTAM: hypothetical protein Slati_3815900 [Sesamum latifolium]|uniref:Vegetative cell wall protein gp1-like n=1 Tax=Sesamum latifolium TaxID=2727402 RepID=A0AAW2U6E5_9LAMI
MASQQPRPAWFRLSALARRPPAPQPVPARPPPPPQPVAGPPIRPPIPPTQTQEPVPPPPPPPASSPPPTAPPPPSPPAPAAAPTRSPVTPPASAVTPPRSYPVATPASQPSPPRAPAIAPPTAASAPQSPAKTAAPPPAIMSQPPTSTVQKETVTTATSAPALSSNIPASAKTKAQPPSSSVPTSPVPKPIAAATSSETVNGKAAAPVSSLKIVQPLERTSEQSPKTKPLSHHPSPSTLLPPAQAKTDNKHEPMIEQKTVLVQQTIDKPMKMSRAHHIDGSASNGKREPTEHKKLHGSEESGMRLITLAGENRGAVMELSPSNKKIYSVEKLHSLQKNKDTKSQGPNGDRSSNETGEGGKSSNKDKSNRAVKMKYPLGAFLNSNIQGLNNSILYNSSFRHNDPGIHISLARKDEGGRSRG